MLLRRSAMPTTHLGLNNICRMCDCMRCVQALLPHLRSCRASQGLEHRHHSCRVVACQPHPLASRSGRHPHLARSDTLLMPCTALGSGLLWLQRSWDLKPGRLLSDHGSKPDIRHNCYIKTVRPSMIIARGSAVHRFSLVRVARCSLTTACPRLIGELFLVRFRYPGKIWRYREVAAVYQCAVNLEAGWRCVSELHIPCAYLNQEALCSEQSHASCLMLQVHSCHGHLL